MRLLLLLLIISLTSCSDDTPFEDITPHLVVNWQEAPFENLSDYGFFMGELGGLIPHTSLILYEPAAELFTDESKKQRLIWLPKGTQMTYLSAEIAPAFPEGSIAIKTFFYENMLPQQARKILETRIMLKRGSTWEFYSYIWNETQTDASLSQNAISRDIQWVSELGGIKSTAYLIPSPNQCALCHGENEQTSPLGMIPMQLTKPLSSSPTAASQWNTLIQNNHIVNAPSELPYAMVSPWDNQETLNERARSYLHVNCAHCHSDSGNASDTPMRLNYHLTLNPQNLGLCISPGHQVPGQQMRLITPGIPEQSQVYFRMTQSMNEWQMPNFGRSIGDDRGVQLIGEWISSLNSCD